MAETRTSISTHHGIRMIGNDPDEHGRAATPLELLFDLTFVIAIGQAASGLAHLLADDHIALGIFGFAFAMFAVVWAWINFSWFASAFDTDDWVYRVCTVVQMIGVVVLALGIPPMFDSLGHGDHVDNQVMVGGYVIMRIAMMFQWLRVVRESPDPDHRRTARFYALTIAIAQIGWTALAVIDTSTRVWAACGALLFAIEIVGPYLAERQGGTPWHAHHIAERYGLLVIIALGE